MDDKTLAKKILENVGGKENVNSLIHCVTRLRFKLKDESVANTEKIKNLDGVMTVVTSGGQYQVVIGDKVDDVYSQITPLLGDQDTDVSTDSDKKVNLFNRFVNLLSSLFMPTLGVMASAGILKGFLTLCTITGWLSTKSGTYLILYAAADSFFYFLPILLGFSAGKTFKVNPFLSAVIGCSLVYPTLVSAYAAKTSITFFNIPVVLMNYTQTLIPIIVAVWLLSITDKQLKKFIPKTLQMIFVPLLSLVIVVPLSFLVVGPITSLLSQALADVVLWIYSILPVAAGFILAGIWQGAVLFGLHWAFIPIFLNNIATKGFDPIDAMLYCTVFGQVGAAFAMALKSDDPKFKSLSIAATISGFVGITEPILYGVTIPHKKSFIMASIGSAFGGAIAGFASAKMYGGFASGGIFGIPMFIGKHGIDSSFIGFLLSLIVAFSVAMVLTLIFVPKVAAKTKINKILAAPQTIYSPLKGRSIALSEINDEVFSKGLMGSGIAVIPENNQIKAPFNGKVLNVFPTKHAISLESDSGIQLLIHLGMNTVELKGRHFDINVQEGQTIKTGQLLGTFDIAAIQKEGYDTTVPIIVIDDNHRLAVAQEKNSQQAVDFSSQLLTIASKKEPISAMALQ